MYDRESRLSQVDAFNIAKLFPGKLNCQYVVNGHPINVGSRTMHTHSFRNRPAADYTVVFYYPTCVAQQVGIGTRQAGFFVHNTNSINTTFAMNSPAANIQLLNSSESYTTLYGGDFMAFSEGGYVWASNLKLQTQSPYATVNGDVIIGHIQFKQLNQIVSLDQLIRLGSSYPAGEEVNLNVAVNNDAMIYDDSTTVTKYATEIIAYAIFIQPARSIQADVNLSFIL